MSDVSVVISDLGEWIRSGKTPSSLSADVQKTLSDAGKIASVISGVTSDPAVPGIVANVEALISSILAVAASRGINLPADYTLFVTLRNLAAGLQSVVNDAKLHAALIASTGSSQGS